MWTFPRKTYARSKAKKEQTTTAKSNYEVSRIQYTKPSLSQWEALSCSGIRSLNGAEMVIISKRSADLM